MDSISALQELMMTKGLPLPLYNEESSGSLFKYRVEAGGVVGEGFGTTKKAAKHNSARDALEKLKTALNVTRPKQEHPPPAAAVKLLKNYIGELNEFSSKNDFKYPLYQECMTSTRDFLIKCAFLGEEVVGQGMNKKDAKQDAARRMLELIRSRDFKTLATDPRFKVAPSVNTVLDSSIQEEIIARYNQLILTDRREKPVNNNTWEARPDIKLEEEETSEALTAQLKRCGIRYTLDYFPQHNPYVAVARIDGTNLHFCGYGSSKEEATRQTLKQVLEVKKSGCSLDTNDLMGFE